MREDVSSSSARLYLSIATTARSGKAADRQLVHVGLPVDAEAGAAPRPDPPNRCPETETVPDTEGAFFSSDARLDGKDMHKALGAGGRVFGPLELCVCRTVRDSMTRAMIWRSIDF